jgi:hypothetical protein
MARDKASDLVLRSRLVLERVRSGYIDRNLANHLAQVSILSRFVTRNGHGELPAEAFDAIEAQLARLVLDFDQTGQWATLSESLLSDLTAIVNEYDRILGTVRLELLAKASAHLHRLMNRVAGTAPAL